MGSVTGLLNQFIKGDESAYRQLFNLHFEGLVQFAERKLGRTYRGLYGAEDVAQSVLFALKCEVIDEKHFLDRLNNRKDLEKTLLLLTIQRVKKVWRYDYRKKRDIRRTRREGDGRLAENETSPMEKLPSQEPPNWQEEFNDTLQTLASRLPEKPREILQFLMRDGMRKNEIAKHLDVSVRTVERYLKMVERCLLKIKRACDQMTEDGDTPSPNEFPLPKPAP